MLNPRRSPTKSTESSVFVDRPLVFLVSADSSFEESCRYARSRENQAAVAEEKRYLNWVEQQLAPWTVVSGINFAFENRVENVVGQVDKNGVLHLHQSVTLAAPVNYISMKFEI